MTNDQKTKLLKTLDYLLAEMYYYYGKESADKYYTETIEYCKNLIKGE